MVQSLHRLKESPSQTAGPYIHIGATPNHAGIEMYGNAGDLGRTLRQPRRQGRAHRHQGPRLRRRRRAAEGRAG